MQRPMNSHLAMAALKKHFGLRVPFWSAALQLCLAEYN
jgi:dTDP-4-dehydrorhamnose reductase